MSDNKKYYYLKLKENFFDADNMKVLESYENGYIYSNIIMKLYLKSLKYDGRLMMTERIPYDPSKINILAKVINHDIAHVKDALYKAADLDIIKILDSGEMFMLDIQNFIGHSSTEGDRKRLYRKKIKELENKSQDECTDERPPS
jgi:predicted phage replisome organizer